MNNFEGLLPNAKFSRSGTAYMQDMKTLAGDGQPRYEWGRFQNRWYQKDEWHTPLDGTTQAIYYELLYPEQQQQWTISASIKMYQDDGTVTPRITIVVDYTDGTTESVSANLIKDGVERRYSATASPIVGKSVWRVRGWVLDHSAGTFNKHSDVRFIQLEAGTLTDWRPGGTGKGIMIEEGTTQLIKNSDFEVKTTNTVFFDDFNRCNNATFSRSGVAYKQDGTQVATGVPRYEAGKFGSGIMIEEGTTNVINNPSFENDMNSWTFAVGAGLTASSSIITASKFHGNKAGKIDITASTVVTDASFKQDINISSGTTFTASAYICDIVGSVSARIRVRCVNIDNNFSYIDSVHKFESGRVTVTGTVPTGYTANQIWISAYVTGIGGTGYIVFDAIQIEIKPYSTSFIDGTRNAETLAIPTTGMSVSAGTWEQWVYVDSKTKKQIPSTWPTVFNIQGISQQIGVWLYHSSTSPDWYIQARSDSNIATSQVAFTDIDTPDGWRLFSVSWSVSGGNMTLKTYVDGILKNTRTSTNFPSSFAQSSFVGTYSTGSASYGNTTNDTIRISNVVRSDTEILAYYNATNPVAMIDDKTVVLLNFDGDLDGEVLVGSGWSGATSPLVARLKGNKLHNNTGYWLTHGDNEWTDVDISVKVTRKQGKEAFIAARYVDTNNLIWCGLNLNYFDVIARNNGSNTILAHIDSSIIDNTEYTLRLVVTNNTITAYLNGVQKYTGTATIPNAGKIGLQSWSSTNDSIVLFDDITVKSDLPLSWSVYGYAAGGAAAGAYGSLVKSKFMNGAVSFKTTSLNNSYGISNLSSPITVSPGQFYTISSYVIGSGFYYIRDATNNVTFASNVGSFSNVTSWTRNSYTFATPPGCTSLVIYLVSNKNATAWFDCVQLEEKRIATSYQRNDSVVDNFTRNQESCIIPTWGISQNQGTIEMWTYVTSGMKAPYNWPYLFNIRKMINSYWGIGVFHQKSRPEWTLEVGSDNNTYSYADVSDEYTPNGWNHFAVTWSTGKIRLYINGIMRGEILNPNLPSLFNGVCLGNDDTNKSSHINTIFDDVCVSNIERTSEDIFNRYSSMSELKLDDYTLALLRFDNNLLANEDIKFILMPSGNLHIRGQKIVG